MLPYTNDNTYIPYATKFNSIYKHILLENTMIKKHNINNLLLSGDEILFYIFRN